MIMKCEKCSGDLKIIKSCGAVKMQCTRCKSRFAIHEVADRLDQKTESQLAQYNAIVYD